MEEIKRKSKTILMISEFEKRPSLYDPTASGYGDSSVKVGMLDEICSLIYDEWDGLSDSDRFERRDYVIRRWKSLRDCYNRTRYPKDQPGSTPRSREWAYAPHLQFLDPFIKKKTPTPTGANNRGNKRPRSEDDSYNDTDNTNEPSESQEFENMDYGEDSEEIDVKPIVDEIMTLTPQETQPKPAPVKNNPKMQVLYSRLQKNPKKIDDDPRSKAEARQRIVADMSRASNNHATCDEKMRKLIDNFIAFKRRIEEDTFMEDEDGDRAFLLSLLSTMKTLPLQKKLRVRSNILGVMEEAMRDDE